MGGVGIRGGSGRRTGRSWLLLVVDTGANLFEVLDFLDEARFGVVGVAGSDEGVNFAFIFPTDDGLGGDAEKVGGLLESEEVRFGRKGAVFDGVEDLEIFKSVAALAANGAGSGEFAVFFPTPKSFGGEIEFFGDFGDGVEFVICPKALRVGSLWDDL